MRHLLILAMTIIMTIPAFAVGTVNQAVSPIGRDPGTGPDNRVYQVAINWTADASVGTVPVTTLNIGAFPAMQGMRLVSVEIKPGTPAPTNLYSVTLTDAAGVDLLSGTGVNLSSTIPTATTISNLPAPLFGSLTFTLSGNSVNSATGSVFAYFAPLAQTTITTGGASLTGANTFSGTNTFTGPVTAGKINGECYVDGIQNPTVQAAVTCAGTFGVVVIPTLTITNLTANVTIPAGVTLRFDGSSPGVITLGNFNLTINGPLVAPPAQIFAYGGTGVVNFAASSLTEVWAIWFPQGDCGAKINAADTAMGTKVGNIVINANCGLPWTTAVTVSANHYLRFIEGGTYTSSASPMVTLNTSGGIIGSGNGNTNLNQTSNGDTVSVASGAVQVTVEKIILSAAGTPTGGVCFHVQSNAHLVYLRDAQLFNCFTGVQQEDTATVVSIDNVDITNTVATNGIGIQVLGGGDTYIRRVEMDTTGTQPFAGIRIRKSGGTWASDSDILHAGYGLLVDPASPNIVGESFFNNIAFDSATNDGMLFNVALGAIARRFECTGCWSATNGGNGVNIQGAGTIDGIRLVGGRYRNNSLAGILLNSTTAVNTEVTGALISGNSRGSAGTNHGVNIAAGNTQFKFVGNRIGNTAGDGNTQGFGIIVNAGASDNYVIANNDMRGNFTGALSDSGTGLNKYIVANLPVAASSFPGGITLPGSTSGSVTLTAPVVAGSVSGAPAVLQTGDTVFGTYRVTTDQTITAGASLTNIPGLSWTFPANTALNVKFTCDMLYSQATAGAADSFGFQDVTVAPTNAEAYGRIDTSPTAFSAATTSAAGVTTAVTVVTMTPSSTSTFGAHIDGLIEQPSNASTSVFNIMAQFSTNNGTIKRGSSCQVF